MPLEDIDGSAGLTTLNGAINSSVTSITITSTSGWSTPGDPYYARIFSSTGTFVDFVQGETVKVTALGGSVLTVQRGADNSTAQSWSDGDYILVVASAAALSEANTHANATTGTPHGTAYLTGTAHDSRSHSGVTAGSATTLATGRDITLTGDVTGTGSSFDGSANLSIATTMGGQVTLTGDVTGGPASFDGTGDVTVTTSLASFTTVEFTPTVTQNGVVPIRVDYCRYLTVGTTVLYWGYVTCVGGTGGGADVTINLPVSAASGSEIGGNSFFKDFSGTGQAHYPTLATVSSFFLTSTNNLSTGLVNQDILAWFVIYTKAG